MNIAEAQQDMRFAYFGGSTGLLSSALAWLVSGVTCVVLSPNSGVVVLLVGGVLIYPAMLLVIGGRYLTFSTLYGLRIYWACGGVLALAAFLLVFAKAPVQAGAFAGAAVEFAFAVAIALAVRGGRLSPRRDAA